MKKIKRKTKYLITIFSTGSFSAISIGTLIYFLSTEKNSFEGYFLKSNPQLNTKENLDFSGAFDSISDQNLKELIKPKIEIEKPIPKPLPDSPPLENKKEEKIEEPKNPIVIVKPKEPKKPEIEKNPVPKPEPPKPQPPKPKEPTPKPKPIEIPRATPQPKPKEDLEKPIINNSPKTDKKVTFKYFDMDIEVIDYEPLKPREEYQSDKNKGITNRIPYINDPLPKVKTIKVTEILKTKTAENAKEILKKQLKGYDDVWGKPDTESFKLADYLEQNHYSSQKLIMRFDELLRSPRLPEFLTPKGKELYPSLKNPILNEWGGIDEKRDNERKVRLISHLDMSKFNQLSENALKNLKEGLITDGEIKIDANGKIDSYTYSPIANSTTARLTRDNSEKRTFGYNTWYGRSPDDVKNNNYPGWSKQEITNEFKKYGLSNDDGIKVTKFTRDKPELNKRNEGIVVEIDAANNQGYNKTKKFIDDLKAAGEQITGYKIYNMGLKNQNQDFKEILAALPNKLPQLELVFESNNTSALIELENKTIDELSLYTTGNALSKRWSFNPFSLKNVAWVNTIDYNVSNEYDKKLKINSRIVFETLAFEQGDSDERINDGLRMVYFVRNNEPIFQGSMGPGLTPDHNEGGNSYPWGLDLSRVKKRKSLKGLIFSDKKKLQNGMRKLKYLTLFNDSETFTITTDELNNAQFKDVMIITGPQMPRTEINFSNGNTTKKLKIVSGTEMLNSNGISNLNVLIDFGTLDKSKIFVNENDNVINVLKSLGKNIEISDENNDFN